MLRDIIVILGLTISLMAPIQEPAVKSEAQPWQPLVIGQGVVVTNEGIVIGDGLTNPAQDIQEVLKGDELDFFLSEIAQHVDAVELRIWTWFLGQNDFTIATVNDFIARAHAHGIQVYLNTWEYPGTHPDRIPSAFQAFKLADTGERTEALVSDGQISAQHIDKANPQALEWMGEQLRRALASFNSFDGYLIVEDRVSDWVHGPFPQHVRYWDSPTYSDAALKSFQAYLLLHGQDATQRFPVDRPELVSQYTQYVPSAPQHALWTYWYQWRFEVFADYIEALSNAVKSTRDRPILYMPWQRVVDEFDYAYADDWSAQRWDIGHGPGNPENAVFGVSLKTLAKRGSIDGYLHQYGEDGTHEVWPMSFNTLQVEKAVQVLQTSSLGLGTFVQLFNYEGRQALAPETVHEEVEIARQHKAAYLVVYDVATLYPRSGRFNALLAEYWKQSRFRAFQNTGLSLIAAIRAELKTKTQTLVSGSAMANAPLAPRMLPESMPEQTAAWIGDDGYIYVVQTGLPGNGPYYVVYDQWENPPLDAAHLMEHYPEQGVVAMHRPELAQKPFQIVTPDPQGRLLWSRIREELCGKYADITCKENSWLYAPVLP